MPFKSLRTPCVLFTIVLLPRSSHHHSVSSFTSPLASCRVDRRLGPSNQIAHLIRGRDSIALSSSFYDDFEDFGELGSSGSSKGIGENEKGGETSDGGTRESAFSTDDEDVMRSLRERMNILYNGEDGEMEDDEGEDAEYDEDDEDEVDLSELESSSFSSVDELIKFAQSKARQKKGGKAEGAWEEENWALPIPHIDKSTGEPLDFDEILRDGVVLIANPSKFYPDIAERLKVKGEKDQRKGGFMGGLFDDPFPTAPQLSGVSPALLAKFGIVSPPTPDQGPDRRATILPVLFLVERDPVMGCKAVTVNRRSGALIGDLASEWNKTSELGPFFIQPVWEGGTGKVITSKDSVTVYDNSEAYRKELPLEMLHMCPYVNGSVSITMCDGLYWGGDPCEVSNAMKDPRLEKPLTGFDFKFFFKDTRWLPTQLEKEIMNETWFVAQVSKEVIFRNRDRLGPMRAKPLWKEIMELLGDDYKHIHDLIYGDDEDDDAL
ncbi:hypothetical protein HJC23_013627 [Cyclotella cryptica]|uniref:Uncharacterized protein n=1 Tax=Cyclotella cryptica TaxID=29204 RepID=A0ABD3PS65_9STRA|eukprot:CCRYP_012631-RA/>CCRYP_012631-RA protein AED:0.01 eAED:0.01 QI:369/1/1/1/0.5/0.33/3/2901/491